MWEIFRNKKNLNLKDSEGDDPTKKPDQYQSNQSGDVRVISVKKPDQYQSNQSGDVRVYNSEEGVYNLGSREKKRKEIYETSRTGGGYTQIILILAALLSSFFSLYFLSTTVSGFMVRSRFNVAISLIVLITILVLVFTARLINRKR